MFKCHYIHYTDVKYNEHTVQGQQEARRTDIIKRQQEAG